MATSRDVFITYKKSNEERPCPQQRGDGLDKFYHFHIR